MLISILWSDFQYVSLKRWVKTAGTVVMALVVLSEPDPYEAMRSVFIRTIYILIPLSAVLVKYFPRFGVEYARWSGGATWKGVTLGKNLLGALCLVSALFVISMLVKRSQGNQPPAVRYPKLVYLLILGLTFWLLKGPPGAYSATSIAVLIIGLATFFTMRRLKFLAHYLSRSAYIVLFGVCVVLLLMKLFDVSLLTFASWLGRDTTLTGRTDKIWGVLLPFALKHPVLGVGYGGFWVKLPADLDVGNDFVNQAHNGYLDVFLQLGVVGLILLVPLMISFFNKARSEFERDYEWASLRISFLPVMLLHNLTETSFVASTMLLWNFFVFLMVVHPERPIHELETHASHWETRRTRNETIL
jgi:O-antigen ligase